MAWYDETFFKVFSVFADVISVIGGVITLWLAVTVNDIRKRYVSKVRIPEIIVELKTQSSHLSQFVGRVVEPIELAPRVSEICALLNSAATKGNKTTGKEIKRAKLRIAELAIGDTTQIDVRP